MEGIAAFESGLGGGAAAGDAGGEEEEGDGHAAAASGGAGGDADSAAAAAASFVKLHLPSLAAEASIAGAFARHTRKATSKGAKNRSSASNIL